MAVVRGVNSEPATAEPPRPHRLRADAERNRAALLRGARAVFAELGLEAPLETIAHRAGVGIATLYRHFPTREQLVAAALFDQVADYLIAAEQAQASDDPWAGFVGFVERICAMQADDRGLGDLLSMALPADQQIEELRVRANAKVIALVERAKSAGKLRADFAGEDLLLLLIANAAIVHVTGQDAPEAWRRPMALQLDAFRARAEALPLPEAPSAQAMARAMLRLARSRGCAGPSVEDSAGGHCATQPQPHRRAGAGAAGPASGGVPGG